MSEVLTDQRPLSYGESLVGLTFNPSGDSKVNEIKTICARLADIVDSNYVNLGDTQSELAKTLFNHTIGEILNCQMNCVKMITLKY